MKDDMSSNSPFVGTTWVTRPYNLGSPDDKTPYFRVMNDSDGSVLDSILLDESYGGTFQGRAAADQITVNWSPAFGWTSTMDTFSGDAEMVKAHGGVFTLARLYVPNTNGESPFDNPVDHYSQSEDEWEKARAVVYTTVLYRKPDATGHLVKDLSAAEAYAKIMGELRFIDDMVVDSANAVLSWHYSSYNVSNPSKVWSPVSPPQAASR